MRFVCFCMNRITISCNDTTANELEWLCKRTLRKPSNLVAVLLAHETQRHLETLSDEERAKVYEELTGTRVVVLS